MAHKVLSSDMAELINAMKLAQQYSATLLDNEYRKGMLKAAHVLAMDSKNLLDAVDNARKLQAATSTTEYSSDQQVDNQGQRSEGESNEGHWSDEGNTVVEGLSGTEC